MRIGPEIVICSAGFLYLDSSPCPTYKASIYSRFFEPLPLNCRLSDSAENLPPCQTLMPFIFGSWAPAVIVMSANFVFRNPSGRTSAPKVRCGLKSTVDRSTFIVKPLVKSPVPDSTTPRATDPSITVLWVSTVSKAPSETRMKCLL